MGVIGQTKDGMNKQIIYEGSPSQLINLGSILIGIFLCWLFVPLGTYDCTIVKNEMYTYYYFNNRNHFRTRCFFKNNR